MTRGKSRQARGSAERAAETEHAAPRPRDAMPRGLGAKARLSQAQPVGAAIGFTPARSDRLTRIATTVMISPSSAIPAETR
jgi:hypothetical protein